MADGRRRTADRIWCTINVVLLNGLERVWCIRLQIHLRQRKVQMSNWKQLEKDISEWLSTFASADIKFRRKFPVGDFMSDGMLITDEILVAVEVEAGQRHPDTNVGKYWWLTARKPYRRIVLFHVYAPGFKPNEIAKNSAGSTPNRCRARYPLRISCATAAR